MEDAEVTAPPSSSGHDPSKRSIFSRLDDIFSAIFRCGSFSGNIIVAIDKIKNNLHILQKDKILQRRKTQDKFVLLKVEWSF